MNRYMKQDEACKYLQISRLTLLKMEEQGLIHPSRTNGGHRRYLEEDLNAGMQVKRTKKESQIVGKTINFSNDITGKDLEVKCIENDRIYFRKDKDYEVKFEDEDFYLVEPETRHSSTQIWCKISKNREDIVVKGDSCINMFPYEFSRNETAKKDGYNLFVPFSYHCELLDILMEAAKTYSNKADELRQSNSTLTGIEPNEVEKKLVEMLVQEHGHSIMALERKESIVYMIMNSINDI